MILKAGTYRFNDILKFDGYNLNFVEAGNVGGFAANYPISFEFDYGEYTNNPVNEISMIMLVDATEGNSYFMTYIYNDNDLSINYGDAATLGSLYNSIELGETAPMGWQIPVQEHTILNDIEVSDTFGIWYIANTNYNEVNAKPLAEITYNGETIAQLNAGETATLSCKDKKMASDVAVKVNEVESKIPEGYIKPEGTLNILRNNTTYDVSQYAEVRIATAHPYEVPLEMLMNNVISDASQATIGNVYKYTGETTDTYENGALYILEEVSE